MSATTEPCGGCGEADAKKACIGCLHFAALSPEAQAREGGELDPKTVALKWEKVETTALEEWRAEFGDYIALATLGHDNDWTHRVNNSGRMGYKSADEAKAAALTDLQGRLLIRLHAARKTVALYDALTPRHEAPADHHERNLTASNAELIEQALSRPPLEAPAEGAGEVEHVAKWHEDRAAFLTSKAADDEWSETEAQMHRDMASSLRARSSDQPKLTVWYGEMPESNGKRNWTAILGRKDAEGFDLHLDGFCFHRSEYPDRARYEADEMRWIIGELAEQPDILAYDETKHSGFAAPAAPSADKLRIAVEALEKISTGTYEQGRARTIARQALAVLKAGGA